MVRAEELPALQAGNVKICIFGAIPSHLSSERAESFLPYSPHTLGAVLPLIYRVFFGILSQSAVNVSSPSMFPCSACRDSKGRLTPLLSAGFTLLPNFPHIPLLTTQRIDKIIRKTTEFHNGLGWNGA